MTSFNKYKSIATKHAAKTKDMRVADKNGGFDPPAEGQCRLRFVGYVELGEQVETFKGAPRIRPKVKLVFELSGKKHPPITLDDGTQVPRRINVELTQSLSERATLFQLFNTMNHAGEASHIAQLLGDAFIGRVYHHTFTDTQGNERMIARLKAKGGNYSIQPPFYEDEDGETKEYSVDAPLSAPMVFFWDEPTLEMWDELYIDGEWDSGRSKNVIQEQLRQAVNWEGSPMWDLLVEDGRKKKSFAPMEPRVAVEEGSVKKASKDDEDDEDAPPPKAKPAAKKPKPAPVDDDEDDEDAPPPKAKPAAKKPKPAPVDDDEDDEDEIVDPRVARVAQLIKDL